MIDYPFYYNPFSLVLFSVDVALFSFVFGVFLEHCKRAGKNLKTKEVNSLIEQNEKNENDEINNEIGKILKNEWKFKNIWNLITSKTQKSLFDIEN